MKVWMVRRCSGSRSPVVQAVAVAGSAGGQGLAGQGGAGGELFGVA